MSALNSPTRNQRAHSACLSDWLTMGSAKDFVRCLSPPPAAESREAAFERWLLMLWPAREDIRAMLTKAAMDRRIAEGSVLAPGAVSDIPEAVAPARRRRTV